MDPAPNPDPATPHEPAAPREPTSPQEPTTPPATTPTPDGWPHSKHAVTSLPAWRRATQGETRWWVTATIAAAVLLQIAVPNRFVLHPRYLLAALEIAATVALFTGHPRLLTHRSIARRRLALTVLGLLAATNAVSLVLLVRQIVVGGKLPAVQLLLGGAEIWVTNIIIFALVYWEYDRGGPAPRAAGTQPVPDLLFPQMGDPTLDRDWEPIFFDYLFVSFTNATAFSPTDTMPLSRWSKMLFMIQSVISFLTVALVAARAVNILPN